MIKPGRIEPIKRPLVGEFRGGRANAIKSPRLGDLSPGAEFEMTIDLARGLMIVLGVTWLISAARRGRK